VSAFSGSYCDRWRDLLPLHALGNPVGEDAGGLRDHLDGCAACRREVLELQEALSLLPYGLAPVRPAAATKERLMQQFRDEAAGTPRVAVVPIAAGRVRTASGAHVTHGAAGVQKAHHGAAAPRGRGAFGTFLLAASFCLFVGSALLLVREHRRLLQSESERAGLAQKVLALTESAKVEEQRLAEVRKEQQFLHARNVELVNLQPPAGSAEEAPQATGRILWDKDHRAWLFLGFQLPAAPADKDYQLWFLVKGPEAAQPVSAGLLRTTADGEVLADIQVPPDLGEITAAALTLEPKGGSEKPTSQPLLLGHI
jgi:predicted anti-sigma-YlaC factor YlaD